MNRCAALTLSSLVAVATTGRPDTALAALPLGLADASQITGVICGVRIEEIEHPLMRQIRYLDNLVEELARGRPMAKILRE